MDSSPSAAGRRRPRPRPQAQSCDPCRSRKVGCDRTRPVCQRCVKRKQNSQCVYSLSPQATLASSVLLRPAQLSEPGSPEPRYAKTPASRVAAESVVPGPAKPTALSGYFGFTSYNAVFAETKQSLSLFAGDSPIAGDGAESGGHAQQTRPRHGISFADLKTPTQEMCLYVLRCLPGQSNEIMAFQNTPSDSRSQFHLAVDRIMATLLETFVSLEHLDETAKLRVIAERVCNNTTKPFRDIHTSAEEYMAQYCGKSLRWESLGLLCAHLERVSDVLDGRRSRRVIWIDGRARHEEARSCLSFCIQLSRQFCHGNDLQLDLCRRLGTLDSVIDGDGTVSCALDHGVAASLLHFLGVHVLSDPRPYEPSLCSENKRRLFAQAFVSDKLNATFTGRPPLLSRRYCSTPLPLDLDDDILTSDSATLLRAAQALDSRGWNTDGNIYPVTLIRARCQVAMVQDELMEIALSPRGTTTIEHVLNLKQRAAQVMTELPQQLQCALNGVMQEPDCDSESNYVRHLIRREHLLGIFFAERLLLRLGYPDEGDILVTSFDLLINTLNLWTHKDRFMWSQRHFAWLVVGYAAPAGGILCQELLRPTFTGMHPKDSRLTRSNIIQKLSLFVGFLEWIDPSEPNGDLCADCKVVVQRVLDQHLNTTAGSNNAMLDATGWEFPANLDFNFDLMDTFDWLRTEDWQ